jgi:hypothetical protein
MASALCNRVSLRAPAKVAAARPSRATRLVTKATVDPYLAVCSCDRCFYVNCSLLRMASSRRFFMVNTIESSQRPIQSKTHANTYSSGAPVQLSCCCPKGSSSKMYAAVLERRCPLAQPSCWQLAALPSCPSNAATWRGAQLCPAPRPQVRLSTAVQQGVLLDLYEGSSV